MSGASGKNEPLASVLSRWEMLKERWALDTHERAALVGGQMRHPDAPIEDYHLLCGEQRIRLMEEVDAIYARIVGDDEDVRAWLRRPNLNLANRTPLDVMAGTPEWMQWLIDNLGGERR